MNSELKKRFILILLIIIILFAGVFIVNELNGFPLQKQTANVIKEPQDNQISVGVNILPIPEEESNE